MVTGPIHNRTRALHPAEGGLSSSINSLQVSVTSRRLHHTVAPNDSLLLVQLTPSSTDARPGYPDNGMLRHAGHGSARAGRWLVPAIFRPYMGRPEGSKCRPAGYILRDGSARRSDLETTGLLCDRG